MPSKPPEPGVFILAAMVLSAAIIYVIDPDILSRSGLRQAVTFFSVPFVVGIVSCALYLPSSGATTTTIDGPDTTRPARAIRRANILTNSQAALGIIRQTTPRPPCTSPP